MAAITPTTRQMSVVKPDSVYKWEINNFDLDSWKTGEVLVSPVIDVTGTEWQIYLFPKGKKEGITTFVAIGLNSLNETSIELKFSFSLADIRYRPIWEFGAVYLFEKGAGVVHDTFIRQRVVVKHKFISPIDEKLRILCTMQILKENPDDQQSSQIGCMSDFENFLNNPQFSDAKFIVDGKAFYAHKNILANGSKVFAAMFEHDMKENFQSTVEIQDIDYEVFQEVLRFVYAGKVNNIERIAENLFIAADKYALDELMAACATSLCDSLSVDNAVACLKFAEMYNVQDLKTTAIAFIASHATAIIHKPGFTSIRELNDDNLLAVFDKI